jgi:hypothetical protein
MIALEKEKFLKDLEEDVQREIGVHHPLTYSDTNLCELLKEATQFEKTLKKKFKLTELKEICSYFNIQHQGSSARKDPFVKALYKFVTSCECQND